MTIVVTGASGFIGRRVLASLEAAGRDVWPIEHRWATAANLRNLLPDDVEACIHLGWYAAPGDYLDNEAANEAASDASLDLAREVHRRGAGRLVLAGTSAEYAPSPRPLVESDPVGPTSVYGRAKTSLHEQLLSGSGSHELSLRWARIFNVTGPGESSRRFLPSVARAVIRGTPLGLSAGDQVRDFLHVDDVAAALVALEAAAEPGVFNVSSGEGRTLRETSEQLGGRLGDIAVLRFGERPRGRHDLHHVVGDNRALRSLGWRRRWDWESTLDATASYWRSALRSG